MSIGVKPPFERGQTASGLFATATSGATPVISATDFLNIEGQIWEFDDINYASTEAVKPLRSNKKVWCMAVRNSSAAIAILPKRLVVLQTDYGYANTTTNTDATAGPLGLARVQGYARMGADTAVAPSRCYPVDEFLPSGGVAQNDVFWIVIKGPAIVKTALAQFTAITQGLPLVAQTITTAAATSTTTGAGRAIIYAEATTHSFLTSGRIIGAAMSACTSQGYHVDILCDVGHYNYSLL